MRARDFREQGRASLKGNWGVSLGVCLITSIIIALTSMIPLLGLFVAGPLALGLSIFFINLHRTKNADFGDVFNGFGQFIKAFCGYFLQIFWIICWTFLLIIPGIIKSYSYAMYTYIMADNPNLTATECITQSRQIMKGNKWRLFCLQLSFLGWAILCVLSLGIGFLWLVPYMRASTAAFYESIKSGQTTQTSATPIQPINTTNVDNNSTGQDNTAILPQAKPEAQDTEQSMTK